MKALLFFAIFVSVIALIVWIGRTLLGKRAQTLGFPTVRSYLYAVPSSDAEKEDAVDLALKGLVISSLGILFAPFLFIGLTPLYYGFRKTILMNSKMAGSEVAD